MRILVTVLAAYALSLANAGAASALTFDFEGVAPFLSAGTRFAGLSFSAGAAVVDEAAIGAITGTPIAPGTVASSGVNLVSNLFSPSFTITLTAATYTASVHTVGSIVGDSFGAITMMAFAGSVLVGSDVSDPEAIGDSGVPEALLEVSYPGITRLFFYDSSLSSASFAIDDLTLIAIPEPTPLAELLTGLCAFASRRRRRGASTHGGEA